MMGLPQSLVFTGHMIDLPDRPHPRFPARLEAAARSAIRAKVRAAVRPGLLGFASGARGGDILFHEIAREFGIRTVIVVPFAPGIFEETSVTGTPTGDWVTRFRRLWEATPEEDRVNLGLPRETASYAACNAKLLQLAAGRGPVRCIALWDGDGRSEPGGTGTMVAEARAAGAAVEILAPADLRLLLPKFAGQRRLLALDGGGIRGLITLGMLEHLEARLRTALGIESDFRLSHYFDFMAGTSTGAIIAAGLSSGMSVAELIQFYTEAGPSMFKRAQLLVRLLFRSYKPGPLQLKLKQVLGDETLLGSDKLQTLMLIVLRNAGTDSPWPLTNNPLAKYNDRGRADCNLLLPLWQLVRGSTAAPTFFPPESINIGKHIFKFVDGGITPYNNPAFQLYRTVVARAFGLTWEIGEEKMLLLSFGTGSVALAGDLAGTFERWKLRLANAIPLEMMSGMAYDQDINCRVVGRCVFGGELDREVGDLVYAPGSSPVTPRDFTYARYDPRLDRDSLDALGFKNIDPARVAGLDAVDEMSDLLAIGRAYGERHVLPDAQYPSFLASDTGP